MEKGFIKTLIMVGIGIVLAFFLYYGYKNFLANPKMIDGNEAKSLFNKTLEDTKSGINQAKDKAVDDAKTKAIEELQKSL